MEQSKSFDPENKYSVPYCVGTVGILYNKSMVKELQTVGIFYKSNKKIAFSCKILYEMPLL